MPNWELYIALVFALIVGFWQGRRYQRKRQAATQEKDLNQYYVKGLNYLLNEQPDAAIDTFVQSLEVNTETLETHIALGKMLRKKGEVDRAIRIHQNLLARPGLSENYSQQAEYELALDFTKAGLLDRAENLLENLISHDGVFKQASMHCLLDIYRDEKEWEKGLAILQELAGSRFSKQYETWAPIRAQFCCELAAEHMNQSDGATARQWIKQALVYDKTSVRANILLGEFEIAEGSNRKGIQHLQRVIDRSPHFLSEVLKPLRNGYRRSENLAKYLVYLRAASSTQQQALLDIEIADVMMEISGEKQESIDYLSEQLQKTPSIKGLNKLVDDYLTTDGGLISKDIEVLHTVYKQVAIKMPDYQCQHCGFEVRSMHWLCPSCKRWESIRYKANQ